MSIFENFDASQWRAKYVVPAMTDAEHVLYFNDPKVGVAATALLECFLWGFLMNMAPGFVSLPDPQGEEAFASLVATSYEKFLIQSGMKIADASEAASFSRLWLGFLVLAGATVREAIEKKDTSGGPSKWMRDYLQETEQLLPAETRHKAFVVSGASGDLVLCMAANAACESMTKLMSGDLATSNAELEAQRHSAGLDVFISYNRGELARARLLGEALWKVGFNVWFDLAIPPGDNFSRAINERVRAAHAVLVCWSPAAASSQWVHAEALVGFDRKVLVPALLESCTVPTPFNSVHHEDMRDWSGDLSATSLTALVGRISHLSGRNGLVEWQSIVKAGGVSVCKAREWQDKWPTDELAKHLIVFMGTQGSADVFTLDDFNRFRTNR
ncbi:MAG: toll/interleukin-1 receptor domain-containing protein [Terricaulis sp.]